MLTGTQPEDAGDDECRGPVTERVLRYDPAADRWRE
jgi:hypothetical protein